MDTQQDTLNRINDWLNRLEGHAQELLDSCDPEEFAPAQAATAASKYITLIVRLLELRQQFAQYAGGDEERLLKIIFAAENDPLLKEPR